MQARQGTYKLSSRVAGGASRWWLPSVRVASILLCGLAVACLSGCCRWQLPAIDPYGSCIFLPPPNSTQLDFSTFHHGEGHRLCPEPAFKQPPKPPACHDDCNHGVCNLFGDKHGLHSKMQSHFDKRGSAGEIQLTPARVIAPVGGEVVLLAGICGQDGYLVKREPLEWMLSPDSVGTFIEVGDDKPGRLSSFLHNDPKVEKLDVDFARGRTSSKPVLIDRGTPQPQDDIQLADGQTWLSLSSPSEGVSRVTVLAPESKIWDRRRLTSTIYWVDAQWEFPAPQIHKSGEPAQLVTRVTRAENLVPAEGWFVEYTITDPSVATFVPPAEGNQRRVRVNADGQAAISVAAVPGGRGTAPIVVDVIRPAQPSDNLPELILGRGQTTVTFSSPGLELEAFGPAIGSLGERLTYSAVVGNPGDINSDNVQLRVSIPAGTKFVGEASLQPTTVTPNVLIWDQGILPAGSQLDVSFVLEALQANTYDVAFEAQGAGLPARQRTVRTQIVEASVEARFAPEGGIAEATVGQSVRYEIDVTNTGRQTLTDLKLLIESSPGLAVAIPSAAGPRYENRVEQTIAMLRPGERIPVGVQFQVQQQGQLNAQLQILSGDKVLAQESSSINGLAPRPKEPKIEVSVEFPETVRAGSNNIAVVRVSNPGDVKLTGIRVELGIPPALRATKVDTSNANRITLNPDNTSLVWSAQDLLPRLPGDRGAIYRELQIEFAILAAVEQSQLTVSASALENVQASDSASFRSISNNAPGGVFPPPGQPGSPDPGSQPPTLPPDDGRQRSNSLQLTLNDWNDPAFVGREIRYNVIVKNDRPTADRNVAVLLRIPRGVNFVGIERNYNSVRYQIQADGTIAIEPIEYMRADEEVVYLFRVLPNLPQFMELQAQATSDLQPTATQTSESTRVVAGN